MLPSTGPVKGEQGVKVTPVLFSLLTGWVGVGGHSKYALVVLAELTVQCGASY
jgi:hypothetical protein